MLQFLSSALIHFIESQLINAAPDAQSIATSILQELVSKIEEYLSGKLIAPAIASEEHDSK